MHVSLLPASTPHILDAGAFSDGNRARRTPVERPGGREAWTMALFSRIKGLLGLKSESPAQRTERLREDFQTRYHHFQLLLTSNNSALDTMTRIQNALAGHEPFSMTFVRNACTNVAARVFQIVRHLNELSPDAGYRNLLPRFHEIQAHINEAIAPPPVDAGGPLALFLEDVELSHARQVGAKMATLAHAKNKLGVPAPNGFVLTAAAYNLFMTHNDLQQEIDRRLQSAEIEGGMDKLFSLRASVQQCITAASLPREIEEAIAQGCDRLRDMGHEPLRLAMRSSALGEDALGSSFAGQYRSQLNVSPESACQAYKEIVAGKYTLQAMAYRLHKGLRDEDVAMCVGVLPMVPAKASGVAYSRDPLHMERDTVLVNAVWGLPKGVVDGSAPVDALRLARDPAHEILQRDVPRKTWRYVCHNGEGLERQEISPDMAEAASLDDAQAARVAQLALSLEHSFGTPQDVEWVLTPDNELMLLQCRPLAPSGAGRKRRRDEPAECVAPDAANALLSGGTAASPGLVCGPVHVVLREVDALNFPQGAVLVVRQALPRWAALLPHAAALVAEQGSVTGHLANVAREFGVPAVLGLEDAVAALHYQDMVTVDGDNGLIFSGRRQDLLDARPQAEPPMLGTPVHTILQQAAEHILPLNLIDPDSPDFKPRYCRTLHDLTRYCHEKAVIEMFQFGQRHQFQERSSRQLYTDAPMQFWVMDLDDGIAPPATTEANYKNFVLLEQIVSVPMLALWRGISSKPWAGPPPVDAKGFMSILMEATCNPALDPAMPSHYTARNYFMIAKHYCSLQSRFGFHFSTVEALVGERDRENSVTFRFKGGAASLDRRIGRAQLIAEVLEHYGFQTHVLEDSLTARAEGLPQAHMEQLLVILGFLTIHTRQLDMVMAQSGSHQSLSQTLRKDIGEILQRTREGRS